MTNVMDTLSPRAKLAAGRLVVREKAPYVTSALLGLVPVETPGLGTIGVTDQGFLLWDPAAVNGWTVDQVGAVLYHEVWHLLRDHSGRAKAMGADHTLFNIAGDAEINDDIRDAGWELPGGCIYPEVIGCEDGKTAEEYYHSLREQCKGSGENSEQGQEPGPGWCGSAAGHALPNEPQNGDKRGKGKGEGEGDGDGDGDGQGQGTSTLQGRTKPELDRMRRQVARQIQDQMEKSRGSVPGGLQRWAEATLEPAKVRWQDKLGAIARSAVAYRAGAVDYKYDRPSRRQYGIGFGIGKPILPCMRQPVPNVLIVVDTSGSMGQKDLEAAMRETHGVITQTGANIGFMVCDAEIHGSAPIKNWQDAAKMLHGGGGTSFIPPFENLHKAKPRPDVMIFITDGCGPAPATPPPGIKVIWLLVGTHASVPWPVASGDDEWSSSGGHIDWGEQIWLDDEAQVRHGR